MSHIIAHVTAEWVNDTAEQLQWSSAARSRALQLALAPPELEEWRKYLDSLLLAGGFLALTCGSLCFVGAHWDALGVLARFLLVDAALAGSALLAYRLGLDRPAGRWALTLAAGLVGVFLALYAQTYQTGAEPYLLFLAWAALIGPWCLRANHPPLWAGWVLLVNLAFFQAFDGESSLGAQALLNLVLAAVAHRGRPRLGWPEIPWGLGLMAATVAGCAGQHRWSQDCWQWLLFFVSSAFFYYRQAGYAQLAGLGFGFVIIDTVWLACNIPGHGIDIGFLLAIVVVIQVSLLTLALRKLRQRLEPA